ncbi:putative cyclase [Burkholderia cepacia]
MKATLARLAFGAILPFAAARAAHAAPAAPAADRYPSVQGANDAFRGDT